jgi:hypothetical protein
VIIHMAKHKQASAFAMLHKTAIARWLLESTRHPVRERNYASESNASINKLPFANWHEIAIRHAEGTLIVTVQTRFSCTQTNLNLVLGTGFEPACLAATASKTVVYANSTTRALWEIPDFQSTNYGASE